MKINCWPRKTIPLEINVIKGGGREIIDKREEEITKLA